MPNNLVQFDIVRATIVSYLPPQTAIQRFFYLVGPLTGTVTDHDFNVAFDGVMATPWKGAMSHLASYRGTMAQILRPLPTPGAATHFQVFRADEFTPNAGAGSCSDPPLPGQVRGLVAFFGTLARRGLNPRTYVPFPCVGAASPDGYTPTAPYISALDSIGLHLTSFGLVNPSPGNSCVVSLVDFRPKSLPTYVFENLTGYIVRQKWATQRRSGAYGRPNLPPI